MIDPQAPESQAIESDDRDDSQSTKATAELSPTEARRLIATSEYSIDLDELGEVSLEVALILARFKGDISLAGLHHLEPAAAQAFRVHRAALSLNGLSQLSSPVADALASHPGHLNLDSIPTLTLEIATVLSRHCGGLLSLDSVRVLSQEAAALLARRHGNLSLDALESLDEPMAALFAQHSGDLSLYGLRRVSSAAITVLADHASLFVSDDIQTRLDAEKKSGKQKNPHRKRTGEPPPVPRDEKELPAAGQSATPPSIPEQPHYPDAPLGSNLESALPVEVGLDSTPARPAALPERPITAQDIRRILRHFQGDELPLDSVIRLSSDVAEALLENRAFHLSLNGLQSLSPEVAAILARRGNSLSLNGLKNLPTDGASALAKHCGWLSLDGLSSLSLDVAKSLSKHEHSLSLKGIESLSDEVAAALCEHVGELYLGNISESCACALKDHRGTLHCETVSRVPPPTA